jgi:hypothetical protein
MASVALKRNETGLSDSAPPLTKEVSGKFEMPLVGRRSIWQMETSVDSALSADSKLDITVVQRAPDKLPEHQVGNAHPHEQPDRNRISGVVHRVEPDVVQVLINVAGHEEQIQIPSALVPAELQKFAKPIWVELDKSDGYRRIVLKERQVEVQPWNDCIIAIEADIANL